MSEQNNQSSERARSFFKRATSLTSTDNFDYAIDMYLQGLHYDPEALEEGHLLLCQLGLLRQNAGGKKPTLSDRVKHSHGKTPLEQMLNAEYLFVMDPGHIPYAEAMLKAAIAGGYYKVADWISNLIFQMNKAAEKPSFQTFLFLKESYQALNKLDKATAACQQALRLRPDDKEIAEEYKNLSAELTMERGNYDKEGDFRKSIKNREAQEILQSQSGVIKTEDYMASAIERARGKVAHNPNLEPNIFELADALADTEQEQQENEAIAILENNYQRKSDFSFKLKAGQIKIRQLRRQIRQAKADVDVKPDDNQAKATLEQLTNQLNQFELEHYRLCMLNYPTDLQIKYEYALRLVVFRRYDEAIPLFQDAQKDPKKKISAMNQIGYCFFQKGWIDDAIDVFTQTLEKYEIKDDAVGKELQYNLARAYEEKGQAQKALDIYRKIAQSDFAYKDASQRVDKLRNIKTEPAS
jgi:tetratricopeptide (TPR) repeat protein